MNNPRLFFPVIDNGMGLSVTAWAISMIGALNGRNFSVQGISYPYPDGAMCIATADFMDGPFDEMVIIDTDVVFERSHLDMLLSHDVPLVFGLYPKKKPGLEWPVTSLDGRHPFSGQDGLVEVGCCARGFMKVRKEVFEALKPVTPTYTDTETGKTQWQYWRPLPGGHSEDFNFCNEYRKVGGKILVDQRIVMRHYGMAAYPIPGTY